MTSRINQLFELFSQNEKFLKDAVLNSVHNSAMKLDMACTFPNVSSFIIQCYRRLRIDDDFFEPIINQFVIDIKIKSKTLYIGKDPKNHFMILLVIYFLSNYDLSNANRCNLLLLNKFYSSLMNKYIKICTDTTFYSTLSSLSKTHLFVAHGGILKGLLYLSQTMFKKYQHNLTKYQSITVFKYLYEMRHRINQSIKSFTSVYHNQQKVNKQKSVDDQSSAKQNMLSNDIKNKVIDRCIDNLISYKVIYPEINRLTNVQTKIKLDIINIISKEMQNITYDILHECYIYLLSNITDLSILNNKPLFVQYTKKLMALKITKKENYFKKIIIQIANTLVNNNPQLNKFYFNSSTMTQYAFRLSVAIYLSLYITQAH